MQMKMKCVCGKILSIKPELQGRKGRCPACGETITVPSQPKPEPTDDQDLSDLNKLLIDSPPTNKDIKKASIPSIWKPQDQKPNQITKPITENNAARNAGSSLAKEPFKAYTKKSSNKKQSRNDVYYMLSILGIFTILGLVAIMFNSRDPSVDSKSAESTAKRTVAAKDSTTVAPATSSKVALQDSTPPKLSISESTRKKIEQAIRIAVQFRPGENTRNLENELRFIRPSLKSATEIKIADLLAEVNSIQVVINYLDSNKATTSNWSKFKADIKIELAKMEALTRQNPIFQEAVKPVKMAYDDVCECDAILQKGGVLINVRIPFLNMNEINEKFEFGREVAKKYNKSIETIRGIQYFDANGLEEFLNKTQTELVDLANEMLQ
jgi:hypothetical protein